MRWVTSLFQRNTRQLESYFVYVSLSMALIGVTICFALTQGPIYIAMFVLLLVAMITHSNL